MTEPQSYNSRRSTTEMVMNEQRAKINFIVNAEVKGVLLGASSILDNPDAHKNPAYKAPRKRRLLTEDIAKGEEQHAVPMYCDLEDTNAPAPRIFEYIVKNERYRSFKPQDGEQLEVKCTCVGSCDENCPCIQMNDQINDGTVKLYDGALRIVKPASDIYTNALVVCGALCKCSSQCAHRIENLKKDFKFEVFRRDPGAGFGVLTKSHIAFGEIAMEFIGEVIPEDEVHRRELANDYAFEVANGDENYIYNKAKKWLLKNRNTPHRVKKERIYIDGSERGNLSRFILNGCFPNLQMIRVIENFLHPRRHRLFFYALHDIPRGTELTIYYGSDYLARNFACKCETLLCQKGPWSDLLKTIKKDEIEEAIANILLIWREYVLNGRAWDEKFPDVINVSDEEEENSEQPQPLEGPEKEAKKESDDRQPSLSEEPHSKPEDSGDVEGSDEKDEDISDVVEQSHKEDESVGDSDGKKELHDDLSNDGKQMIQLTRKLTENEVADPKARLQHQHLHNRLQGGGDRGHNKNLIKKKVDVTARHQNGGTFTVSEQVEVKEEEEINSDQRKSDASFGNQKND